VPAGFDENGLPVGVQLTAACGREHTLLAAARILAGALPEVQWTRPARAVAER
jgi:Asp-tRNA(Asn)/Glu-tRNA(Gln) amidotransferase A subunit family amidase